MAAAPSATRSCGSTAQSASAAVTGGVWFRWAYRAAAAFAPATVFERAIELLCRGVLRRDPHDHRISFPCSSVAAILRKYRCSLPVRLVVGRRRAIRATRWPSGRRRLRCSRNLLISGLRSRRRARWACRATTSEYASGLPSYAKPCRDSPVSDRLLGLFAPDGGAVCAGLLARVSADAPRKARSAQASHGHHDHPVARRCRRRDTQCLRRFATLYAGRDTLGDDSLVRVAAGAARLVGACSVRVAPIARRERRDGLGARANLTANPLGGSGTTFDGAIVILLTATRNDDVQDLAAFALVSCFSSSRCAHVVALRASAPSEHYECPLAAFGEGSRRTRIAALRNEGCSARSLTALLIELGFLAFSSYAIARYTALTDRVSST